MSGPYYYVRVDRGDCSRTYRGTMPAARAEREAAVWREVFPLYRVEVIELAEAREDVRRWTAATSSTGRRYYPQEVTA